jgi:MFS family permease
VPVERLANGGDESASPERASLLTRNFLLVMAGYLAGMLAHGMAIWSIAAFVDAMGLDAWIGGVALGGIAFTALASRRIAGRAIDRDGSRLPAFLGTSAMIVGGVFYRLSAEAGAGSPLMLVLLAVAVMIHGAGFATMTTASFSFVGEAAPPGRRGEAIGYYSAFQPIVQGLAATASFAVVAAGGFGMLFVAVPTASAAATVFFWLMREPHREARPAADAARTPARFDRAVLAPVVMVGILTSAGGAATLTIPLLGLGAGIGNPGVFYLANAVSGFAMRLIAGRISDRQGRWRVAAPGLILVSVAFGGLAAFRGLGVETFVIAGIVYGIAMAAALPALQALVLDRGRPEHRGANVAVMGMGQDIGYGTGSVLTGFVVGALGPAPGLVAGCVGPLATLALLAVDTKRDGSARSVEAAAEVAG